MFEQDLIDEFIRTQEALIEKESVLSPIYLSHTEAVMLILPHNHFIRKYLGVACIEPTQEISNQRKLY